MRFSELFMPAARDQTRCQMPDRVQRMPDTRVDARYQMPDRVWRMPDTRLDARCQFERVISSMETTECQYMDI